MSRRDLEILLIFFYSSMFFLHLMFSPARRWAGETWNFANFLKSQFPWYNYSTKSLYRVLTTYSTNSLYRVLLRMRPWIPLRSAACAVLAAPQSLGLCVFLFMFVCLCFCVSSVCECVYVFVCVCVCVRARIILFEKQIIYIERDYWNDTP